MAIRERTLVLLAASTGLRQSELFGLKWGDIDFAEGTLNVTRSLVCGFVGPCKTESSQKPVPIHSVIVEALEKWKAQQRYRKLDDRVFARGCRRGRQPYWGQAILGKYIRPGTRNREAVRLAHLQTYILDTPEKRGHRVQGHAGFASTLFPTTTLDIYTQTITPAKRAAQAAVMSLVFSSRPGPETHA